MAEVGCTYAEGCSTYVQSKALALIAVMKSVGHLSLYQINLKYIYPPPSSKSVAVTVADCRTVILTVIATVKSVAN